MTEIQELLQRYFDLLYTCDVSRYDLVFHPNAQLQTIGDNGYAMIAAPAYREILSKRASPASLGAERADEVLTIDLSSSTTAAVKAQALINGVRYRDNLTLLKVADGWRIVSKVYCVVRA